MTISLLRVYTTACIFSTQYTRCITDFGSDSPAKNSKLKLCVSVTATPGNQFQIRPIMEENNRLVFFLPVMDFRKEMIFLSTRTQAGEVIGELVANFGNPKHSYLFASTSKEEDTIHVRANMSDDDVMNVALSIIKRLSESYAVESILRAIEETLR